MKWTRLLAGAWNGVIHPYLEFRVGATLAQGPDGEGSLRLQLLRRGLEGRGVECTYEIEELTIALHGTRPVYEGGQFEITGEQSAQNPSKSGVIRVDRAQRLLDIQLVIAGKPSKYNGICHYDCLERGGKGQT
jgi:hypothetical protein